MPLACRFCHNLVWQLQTGLRFLESSGVFIRRLLTPLMKLPRRGIVMLEWTCLLKRAHQHCLLTTFYLQSPYSAEFALLPRCQSPFGQQAGLATIVFKAEGGTYWRTGCRCPLRVSARSLSNAYEPHWHLLLSGQPRTQTGELSLLPTKRQAQC